MHSNTFKKYITSNYYTSAPFGSSIDKLIIVGVEIYRLKTDIPWICCEIHNARCEVYLFTYVKCNNIPIYKTLYLGCNNVYRRHIY